MDDYVHTKFMSKMMLSGLTVVCITLIVTISLMRSCAIERTRLEYLSGSGQNP